MGAGWKNVNPSPFFKFSPEPANNFSEDNKAFLEASNFDVTVVESLLRVDPTQRNEENTKCLTQDFIDFAIKTHWKLKKILNLFSQFQVKIIRIKEN